MLGTVGAIGAGGIGQGGITGGAATSGSGDVGDAAVNSSGRVNIQTGGGNKASGDGMALPEYLLPAVGIFALLALMAWIARARIMAGK